MGKETDELEEPPMRVGGRTFRFTRPVRNKDESDQAYLSRVNILKREALNLFLQENVSLTRDEMLLQQIRKSRHSPF